MQQHDFMQQVMQQTPAGFLSKNLCIISRKGANIAPEGRNLNPERFVFVKNNSNFDSYLKGKNK
jgi:hypothetical protein